MQVLLIKECINFNLCILTYSAFYYDIHHAYEISLTRPYIKVAYDCTTILYYTSTIS